VDSHGCTPRGTEPNVLRGLTVPELLDEIKECVSGGGFSRNQTNREIRDRLLPALLELKKKTYCRKPGFYESLAAIGLNADTVRQWFHRSHAAGEIAELMMEPKRDEPETPLPERDRKSPKDLLLEHCAKLRTGCGVRDRETEAARLERVVDQRRINRGGREVAGSTNPATPRPPFLFCTEENPAEAARAKPTWIVLNG
jgi:hypothetical protein